MIRLSIVLLMLAALPATASNVSSNKKIITGWLENVYIPSISSRLRAKLDTGAKTSSIDAEIIDIRETGNEDEKYGRVIFTVEDNEGNKKTLERKIIRWVKIKKKGSGFIRRPVVMMEYCIAGKLIDDEVNLSSRQNFIYPVLIGRNMLTQAGLVVDTSKIFTRKPNCKELEENNTTETPVPKPAKTTVKKETPAEEKSRLESEMKQETESVAQSRKEKKKQEEIKAIVENEQKEAESDNKDKNGVIIEDDDDDEEDEDDD